MTLIDEIYAWASYDPVDDIEGVCAFLGADGNWMPLLAADKDRLDSLRPMAIRICNTSGKTMRLIRLSQRDVVETIEPGTLS